ncbi:MAG: YtzC family protein [Bacillus sp. (in: firmicutes)]
MATRQSIDHFLTNCHEALTFARDQYNEASRQEHFNEEEYTQCQQMLESAHADLEQLMNSSNGQQREQLYRMRAQLEEMQHNMIVLRH